MKKICFLMGLLLAVTGVGAQEQNGDATTQRLDSLQQVVNTLTSNVETLEKEELNRKIWKDRAKYFNLGYVNQTLTDKTQGFDVKSDFGVSLSNGKTYYLHKKPIAGMIKFGLDWTWLDINYAKSTWEDKTDIDEQTGEPYSTAIHQAEIGMQFGPSLTINPVHHLKVSGYFRVTPSYSLLYMDETIHHHYVTMFNAGCALAWKVISVGVEWRWGTAKYNGLSFSDQSMDEGAMDETEDPSLDDVMDQLKTSSSKFKTSSLRLYVSFRF